MSTWDKTIVRAETPASAVKLLYVCDFPPSHLRGGTILMSRLLQEYPRQQISVVSGSTLTHLSPSDGRLDCEHILFPATDNKGRWGLGRLKAALDWLLVPVLTLLVIWLTRRKHADVIVTVAYGHFFIAAALAARITGTPYILFVHDDWVFTHAQFSYVLRYVASPVFHLVARGASHIYAVSWQMQQWLMSAYGVASEVQLPSCEPHDTQATLDISPGELRIIFAGTGSAANEDGIRLIIDIIKRDELKKYGIDSASLRFYTTPMSNELKRELGFDHPCVHFHPWVAQQELPRVLKSADILFLPFSFHDSQRVVVRSSFPSKLADYLASGTPILMLGPDYADIVRYAKQAGFAEVVDRNDREAVASAIARVVHSSAYRDALRSRASEVFMQNHNLGVQRREFVETIQRLSRRIPRGAAICASGAYGE